MAVSFEYLLERSEFHEKLVNEIPHRAWEEGRGITPEEESQIKHHEAEKFVLIHRARIEFPAEWYEKFVKPMDEARDRALDQALLDDLHTLEKNYED